MKIITHITSAHPRNDTRIFHRMCQFLASNDCKVNLIVADGKSDDFVNNVFIHDVGCFNSRRDRILNSPSIILAKAVQLNSDLYHIHDPELLGVALRLRSMGKKVIFDCHEDAPLQMLTKPYFNPPIRWILSKGLQFFQFLVFPRLSGLIGATPFITNKLVRSNLCVVNINNYPSSDELYDQAGSLQKFPEIAYVGAIAEIRGILEIVNAMDNLASNARLNLVGLFDDHLLQEKVSLLPGWSRVNYAGSLDRLSVREVLSRSVAGIVTFHPTANHINAQPNKMYEYMSAAIPVIASDFPLWREIVAGNDCGVLVNPLDPIAIADAIDYFLENPEVAKRMGRNGRKAIENSLNWQFESCKLLTFYKKIFAFD